jgi:hypothetical protein
MSIFPERLMGRKIPIENIPKFYVKKGKVYETKSNKEVKRNVVQAVP